MRKIFEILKDFFLLFVPSKCVNCGISLMDHEHWVCKECLFKIPKTNYYKVPDNAVSKVFWGRAKLEFAFSFYFFSKESILQNLIHEIKYHGGKELAYELGREFATELKNTDFHKQVECIIPVPLHPQKEKKRCYNQCYWIAKGISDILNIPVSDHVLNRTVYTSTQTKKNRIQRWDNVKNAFELKNESLIENKHVALIDDVITTGATIEACATQLLQAKGTKVSVISLAFATD